MSGRACSRMRLVLALATAFAVAAPMPARTADLGVRGQTWPVAEPDLLAEIEARLLEMKRTGAMARIEREAGRRARARLEEPEPVAGIAPATRERTRLFDPSVTVDRDVRAADGTVVARVGTVLNPLAHANLTRDLLFIDGRREVEVAWALGHGRPATVVLLAGRPLALSRRHRRPFFFDQGGRLSARLGLAATPTLVERAGAKLRITEVPLDNASGSGWALRPGETE